MATRQASALVALASVVLMFAAAAAALTKGAELGVFKSCLILPPPTMHHRMPCWYKRPDLHEHLSFARADQPRRHCAQVPEQGISLVRLARWKSARQAAQSTARVTSGQCSVVIQGLPRLVKLHVPPRRDATSIGQLLYLVRRCRKCSGKNSYQDVAGQTQCVLRPHCTVDLLLLCSLPLPRSTLHGVVRNSSAVVCLSETGPMVMRRCKTCPSGPGYVVDADHTQ